MFADKAEITVQAGNGGNGLASFRREKYVPDGGPDGGDGGRGGSVIFVVEPSLTTLADFKNRKFFKAQNGGDGRARNCKGADGENVYIKVPVGTLVKDKLTGLILADMTDPEKQFVAAKGGNGGWGNPHFKTPTRQAPAFAKSGIRGVCRELVLELKLIADVGLCGFPNVGKSTLLASVTQARPKIANYHFTTLEPNLGVVDLGEGRSFVLADIPGIIEGAHEGVGLGHDFLRHLERTRLLIHVVDVSGLEGRNPIDDFKAINEELALYQEALAGRPQIVAANKIDVLQDEAAYRAFCDYIKKAGYPLYEISAATQKGVSELMNAAQTLLSTLPPVPIYEEEALPEEEGDAAPFTVSKDGDVFVVTGPFIERLLGSVNFEDDESAMYFQRALRKKGVIDALEAAGVEEGDTVRLPGDVEFDFVY